MGKAEAWGVVIAAGARLASGVRRAALDPVATQALEELRGGEFRVDPALVEVLADHVHALAEGADEAQGAGPPSLDGLCAAAGCRWAFADLSEGQEGRLDPWGQIQARRHRDPARVRLVVLHEVAHWVLGRSGCPHAHADVWALTLALGAPREVVERLRREGRLAVLELAGETGLPAWAAEARIERG